MDPIVFGGNSDRVARSVKSNNDLSISEYSELDGWIFLAFRELYISPLS